MRHHPESISAPYHEAIERMSRSDSVKGTSAAPKGPTTLAERIISVDVLRGLAILGILLMNISSFSGQAGDLQTWAEPLDRAIFILTRLFIEAKFYSLFSLLFGWGMALQMARAEARGDAFIPRILRRLSVLFLMGLTHAIFLWSGDILAVYAICGVILLLFRNRSDRTLLFTAAVFLLAAILIWIPGHAPNAFRTWYAETMNLLPLATPPNRAYANGAYWTVTRVRFREFLQSLTVLLYAFGKVFAMFLVGFLFGRRKVFEHAQHNPRFLRPLLWLGLTFGLTFNMIYVVLLTGSLDLAEPQRRFFANAARTIGAPALMVFYVVGLLHLMQRKTWGERMAPLADVGRMALTNYILQSVVATFVFYGYGLGLFGRIDPTFGLIFTLLLFAGQVRLSRWWLEHHRFGPLEWAWRSLTYLRVQKWYLHEGEIERLDSRRFADTLTNIVSPARMLAFIWLMFAIWGAGLVYWDARLDRKLADVAPTQPITTTEPEEDLHIGSAPPEEAIAVEAAATPFLEPYAYNPSTSLLSGETYSFGVSFDAEYAYDTIETITAPPYSGRQAGTPNGYASGEYIAQQFAELGLQPAGEGGSYFQPFPVEVLGFSSTPSLQIRTQGNQDWDSLTYLEDYAVVLRNYAGGGSADGHVVWANNCAHDDFDSITVLEQIVFCRESPHINADREALEHGAIGLLLLTSPDAMPLDFAYPYHQALLPEPIPTLLLSKAAAATLLAGSGWTLSDISLAYTSFPLETEVRMAVPVAGREACSLEGCTGRNVLGVLSGRDPDFADEIVILGAHYDHMGQAPDGTIWAGANDNASGVAVLLEIARIWKENGYAPRRTVLFAAWDAEELGLIGSRYYVDHPIFPIEATTAMLQLDMVGAGTEELYIDGGGVLEPMLISLADQLRIETRTTNHGRSDHGPFLQAGIPANLLIWFGGDDSLDTYHRPTDLAENIEIPKLSAAGKLTHLALLSLVEGEPAAQSLLARRAAALQENDLQSFLATSSDSLKTEDALWFTTFTSLKPMNVEMRAASVHIHPGGAVGRVILDYDLPMADGEGSYHKTIDWPVRFEYAATGWRWAGPDLRRSAFADGQTTGFSLSYNPGIGDSPERFEKLAADRYAFIAESLGLSEQIEAELQLFESAASLRASTHFAIAEGTTFWAAPGSVKLVAPIDLDDTTQLDGALTHLLLLELGFPHGEPSWLWNGLPLMIEQLKAPDDFQASHLPHLQEVLEQEAPPSGLTADWAVVSALGEMLSLEPFGIGLQQSGEMCRHSNCMETTDLDQALLKGLGMTSQALEEYGISIWSDRLETAQRELDTLLARRSAAWRSGHLTAFLSTVDPTIPGLVVEQQLWFQARESGEINSIAFSGKPLLVTEEGLRAEVTLEIERLDEEGVTTTKTTRFVGSFRYADQGLLWAGAPFESSQQEAIHILYPQAEQQLAQNLLSLFEPILGHLPAALDLQPDLTLQVKLYTDRDTYQASLPPDSQMPFGLETWSRAGTTIKLYIPNGENAPHLSSLIAKAATRSALLQSGVDTEWLLRGLTLELSSKFDSGWMQSQTSKHLFELIKSEETSLGCALNQLPIEGSLEQELNARVDALAWDTLRFLRWRFGDDALPNVLQRLRGGLTIETALLEVVGLDLESFQKAWWDSLTQGHADQRWIEWMMAFQEDAVMEDIQYLAGESFAGRRAGSPETEEAAAWIADKFEAYGLEPIIETVLPASNPPLSGSSANDGQPEHEESYFQSVPLVYSGLSSAPTLQAASTSGDFIERLIYKSDFILPADVLSGSGDVEGRLVWVLDETYQGMDLSGKIALRPKSNGTAQEIQRAVEHGAAGLIIAGDESGVNATLAKAPLPLSSRGQESIPVFELTKSGFDRLRKAMDLTVGDLYNGPSAQVLDVQVQMQVPLTPPVETASQNVLGLLRGSNPALADQVILLSAHYDHVGDEPAPGLCIALAESSPDPGAEPCTPDGRLRYPGANNDASGVAMLLEIARLWQASGYRPQYSVLFVAWTAQEHGELGSSYFLQNPPLALENIRAVLHLDSVGGGTGYYLEAHYDWDLDAEPLFYLYMTEDLIQGRLARSAESIQNDHSVFRDRGIPALYLTWRGSHERNMPLGYDDPLEPSRLGIGGRMVGLAAMMLAR
jgi:uncharacterized protein